MLIYPDIDPVALQLGPIAVRWYGLMYLIGFSAAWFIARYRAEKSPRPWLNEDIDDLLFYTAIGVIVGGRFGYVFFYGFGHFLEDPLWLFRVWEGGMAFHGGLLGVLLAVLIYAKKSKRHYFDITDFGAAMVPLGFAAGRLGNFIGGELWGRPAPEDLPWAMVFPHIDQIPRHPSQLYQFALEGVALFALMFWFSHKSRPRMAATGLALMAYGIFRSIAEFYRQPDAHLNFIAFDWLTMGQLLSAPMIIVGLGLLVWAYQRDRVPNQS